MTSDPMADNQTTTRWIPLESNPEVRLPQSPLNAALKLFVDRLYRIYLSGFQFRKPKLYSAVVVLKSRRSVVSKGRAYHLESALC